MSKFEDSSNDHACKICGNFLAKGEHHDEFDFYVHPGAKDTIRKLQAKTQLLKIFDTDEYAIHQKIRGEHGVILPAYTRLLNCWKWMLKLMEVDAKQNKEHQSQLEALPPQLISNPDLPF